MDRHSFYRILWTTAAVSLSMWVSSARADFTGLFIEQHTDPAAITAGLFVCDLYAVFDNPTDRLLGTAFSDISTNSGAYYQHPFGGDTAPDVDLIDVDPLVAFDSFVTISLFLNDGSDETGLSPDWDQVAFNNSGQILGDWYNGNPDNTQGVPDGNGHVLIARLTVQDPVSVEISGSLNIGWREASSTDLILDAVTVFHDTCPADFNNDGSVSTVDLLSLLGAWGPCVGCPQDINGDGAVSTVDLLALLGAWGPCGL